MLAELDCFAALAMTRGLRSQRQGGYPRKEIPGQGRNDESFSRNFRHEFLSAMSLRGGTTKQSI